MEVLLQRSWVEQNSPPRFTTYLRRNIFISHSWTKLGSKNITTFKILDILFNFVMESSPNDKNLVCEFFMHDFLVSEHTNLFPNVYMGDVQMRAFMSILYNQSEWKKEYEAFNEKEVKDNIMVRKEEIFPQVAKNGMTTIIHNPQVTKKYIEIQRASCYSWRKISYFSRFFWYLWSSKFNS